MTIARGASRTLRSGPIVLRTRFFTLRVNYCVLLLAIWAMTLGSVHIPFVDVFKSVAGEGSKDQEFIVRSLRLPRVIYAMLVGVALAMSGAVFQGLVQNPLVSPDITGIDSLDRYRTEQRIPAGRRVCRCTLFLRSPRANPAGDEQDDQPVAGGCRLTFWS
jgi:hypothetical protein